MRTRNQGYTPLAREPLASGHSRASGLFFPLIVRSLASERPAPTGERAGLAIGARSRAVTREQWREQAKREKSGRASGRCWRASGRGKSLARERANGLNRSRASGKFYKRASERLHSRAMYIPARNTIFLLRSFFTIRKNFLSYLFLSVF